MSEVLLDYRLDPVTAANPTGPFALMLTGTTSVIGPGTTYFGRYDEGLDFGVDGRGSVDIATLKPDLRRFCIRVVFRARGPVVSRGNLVESDMLPFTLFVDKGGSTGEFDLLGRVAPASGYWGGPDTIWFKQKLKTGTWYTADLVYDTDTLGLFVDGACVGVHAFPQGTIEDLGGTSLFIGTAADGKGDHFDGAIAAVQWHAGIPAVLEPRLHEQRSQPEWFISYKREALRGSVDLGQRTSRLNYYDFMSQQHLQGYERGAILYHDGVGAAFEMHGPILDFYFSYARALPMSLGHLVSDVRATIVPGGLKSQFNRGGIYWSAATGAIPVAGQIYLEYETAGETRTFGFPVQWGRDVQGGREQEFQRARLYAKTDAGKAFEVHGGILERFLATGGVGRWGFPISDERAIMKAEVEIGRRSDFEGCTFFWSGRGAHEVRGDIRKKYAELGGPAGSMGFPTSDESDIPGVAAPARYNTFEQGSILWFGDESSVVVAHPFQVFIGEIDSIEDEGLAPGENDIYCEIELFDGGPVPFEERYPKEHAWQDANLVQPRITLPRVINPNDPALNVTLIVRVFDEDGFLAGADKQLGQWVTLLNMANGWGFRTGAGLFDSGPVAPLINSIKGSVKRVIDVETLSETQKWWGVAQQKTKEITYPQFRRAFRDVNASPDGPYPADWLQKRFYELVARNLAENGNCFGMCLEAIYARKGLSRFSQPLDEITRWGEIKDEVNVKHLYQDGASTLWWVLREIRLGRLADPKLVFRRTRDAFAGGDNPVLCLTQNRDLSGAAHVVMPVAWDDLSDIWTITVMDPFFPKQLRKLKIDRQTNRFSYDGEADYAGGELSGGRLYFIPFHLLRDRPRTPVWDAILILLSGGLAILGGDAETARISDLQGRDLDALGEGVRPAGKEGQGPGYFASFKGLGVGTPATNPGGGELLLRMGPGDAESNPGTEGPVEFIHTVTGIRRGKFQYLFKSGLSELTLSSTLERGERAQVQVGDLAASGGEVHLTSMREKLVKLVLKNKLGIGGDYVQLTVDRIPLSASQPLQLNPKPGIGGIELVGQLADSDALVSVEGLVAGKKFDRQFKVPLGAGVSLEPSVAISQKTLAVASIAQLFGDAVGGKLIKAM